MSTQIAFFAGLQSYYWGSECICDLQIEESFVILLHVIYVSYYIAFTFLLHGALWCAQLSNARLASSGTSVTLGI